MIWHIFKKDFGLLWWAAAGLAALHFGATAVLLAAGTFPTNPRLARLEELLLIAGLLGAGFLIAAAVHQDAIPGVRQDWLVRPIRRRDLLLAKLLFATLMVQLPIFAADFTGALANGFPFGRSIAVSASHSAYLLLATGIPFLAFAALTRNLMEAVAGGVVVFFGVAAGITLAGGVQERSPLHPVIGTGLEWIANSGMLAAAVMGAAIILVVQYFRRGTLAARGLTVLFALLCMSATFMPWQPAFAVQRAVTGDAAQNLVKIEFYPGAGRFTRGTDLPRGDVERFFPVYIPLRVSGLPASSVLLLDRAEIRLAETSGRTDVIPNPGMLIVPQGDGTPQKTHHGVLVPSDLYERIKDKPVQFSAEYFLTLLQPDLSAVIAASSPRQLIHGVGQCATQVNATETAVQLRCVEAGKGPVCATAFLEYVPSGARNPERFSCDRPDYSPFVAWRFYPDALTRFGVNLPFRDLTGLAKFPVDGSMLPESRVFLRTFKIVAHVTENVVIPEIHLSDWESVQANR